MDPHSNVPSPVQEDAVIVRRSSRKRKIVEFTPEEMEQMMAEESSDDDYNPPDDKSGSNSESEEEDEDDDGEEDAEDEEEDEDEEQFEGKEKMLSSGKGSNESPRMQKRASMLREEATHKPDGSSDDAEWSDQPEMPETVRRETSRLFRFFDDKLDKKDCGEEENKELYPIIKAFTAGSKMITAFDMFETWDDDLARKTVASLRRNLELAKYLERKRSGCPDKKSQKKKVPKRKEVQKEVQKEENDGTPILLRIRPLEEPTLVSPVLHTVQTRGSEPLRRRGSTQSSGFLSRTSSVKKIAKKIVRRGSSASQALETSYAV